MIQLSAIRAQLALATSRDADILIAGRIELPDDGAQIIVRFNTNAYVEFPVEGLVLESITAFGCQERLSIAREPSQRLLGLDNWVHLKIRYGTKCILHYKTVSIEFTINRATQQPFYIDTNTLEVIYLDRRSRDPNTQEISCDEFSDDRFNKEVTVYTNRACCCTNNHIEAYGFVSCDDGWRSPDCWPRDSDG